MQPGAPIPFGGRDRTGPGRLRDQAGALARGEVTSQALVAAALRRADESASELNAFRVLRAEAALSEAAGADTRLEVGDRLPLLGVPVAIKDDSDIAGETTPFGCAGPFQVKQRDSEAVRRLRAAGAIVIGKTNTPELGLYPWTEGRAFGITRNPWNPAYTPGGSSGGSAAAVAGGVVAGALGSDGAGSVRIPAAWTNLVGIKPQRGRVSTWPDPEAFNGITCIGPLARDVADAALVLECITGGHPGDRHSAPTPVESFTQAASHPPRRLRIALALRPPWVFAPLEVDRQVLAAVRSVAERLAGLGHTVEEGHPRYGPMGLAFTARASAGVADWLQRVPDPGVVDPRTLASARLGGVASGRVLRLARAVEAPLARLVGRIFKRFDVLLTPVTAQPPFLVGRAAGLSSWSTDRLMAAACPYTWPWNFLGWPALSAPAGFVYGGLPVGVHLAGPANSEPLLISLAAELESATGWAGRLPREGAAPDSAQVAGTGSPGPA